MMSGIRLSKIIGPSFFNLHKEIKNSAPSEVWCKGGRGSLKSSYISIEIFLQLSKDPMSHAFISRRYDNELRDSVYGQMQWAAQKLGIEGLWRFMVSPMQAINIRTGQKILFRGIDNPLKAKSINPGRGYVKIFWAEEVDQYGLMEELRSILQSIFRGQGEKKTAFFSFNPPKSSRSWVNSEVKIEKKGRIVHHSDYRSAPREWLGERFIADAEHLSKVNNLAYRHEYLGEEVGTGLEIFTNITIRKITKEEKQAFGQINQGLDFGYAVDPLSFERMYYDSKKRKLYIFEEISGIGISNRELSIKMTAEQKNTETIADSAEPKSIDELRRDFGLRIKSAKKGPGSIEFGIKWLSDLEEIIIDQIACPMAAKEFINYALEISRSGDVISKYPDKDNHSIDSVRYGLENEMAHKLVTVPKSRPF